MGFWIFMTLMTMLLPLFMLLFGLYFTRKSPKEINYLFGYRTTRSMKNKDTWEFAHKKIGKLWLAVGAIILPVSAVIMVLVLGQSKDVIGNTGSVIVLLQLVPLIATIFPVEKALKENFDEEGNKIK